MMLLVELKGKVSDQTWTRVDPSLGVQIISLKHKAAVSTKATSGINWTPFPRLAENSQDMVLTALQRLIARRALDSQNIKLTSWL